MNLNYFTNIPFAANDPSVDQPDMQTNTNSIDSWVNIDHYGFRDVSNLGGLHTQVTMPVLPVIPIRLLTTSGILYTKNVPVALAQSANTLFYTPGTSTKEYQLTRTISSNTEFNRFATNNINQNTGPGSGRSGWTFLPGGMLLQYGTYTGPFGAGTFGPFTVNFAINFLNAPYSITLALTKASPASSAVSTIDIVDGTVGISSFDILIVNASIDQSFSWMAIGV